MSDPELKELGEDIKKNGLTSPVVLWQADPKAPEQLLDGRNRLDAIELVTGKPVEIGAPSLMAGEDFLASDKVIVLDKSVDPYAYVVSANLVRRQLTAEQKRDVITALLKANPTKSDRRIAEEADSNRTTVGQIRKKLEQAGTCQSVDTRTDSKGRKQPASKKSKVKAKVADTSIGFGDEQPVIDVRPPPEPEKGEYPPGYDSPYSQQNLTAAILKGRAEVAQPPIAEPESAAQPQSAPPAEDDSEYVTGVMVRDWIARFTDCGVALGGVSRWIEQNRDKLSKTDLSVYSNMHKAEKR
jgi:hypothetical protein